MMGEAGEDLRQRPPGVLARGDGGEFNVRVRQEQADEFFARVSRGAHDGYWFGIHHKKTPPD